MMYKNQMSIITDNNITTPQLHPPSHWVVEPELLLYCSSLTTSARVVAPLLATPSAVSYPHSPYRRNYIVCKQADNKLLEETVFI